MRALAQRPQTWPLNKTAAHSVTDVDELVAFCPGCKTMETLWLNNGRLMPTRKFNQQGKQVFHDCGTVEPCRLYRTW